MNKRNYWLEKVPVWASQIGLLFNEAETVGLEHKRAQKCLFAVAWRMGLLRFLRTTREKEINGLLVDQTEPRYWWGSWEAWEAGKRGWLSAALACPLDFSNFVKLCLAEEEIVRAATENPEITPDTPPMTSEEEADFLETIVASVESRPLDITGDYAGVNTLRHRLEEISTLWLQQRTRLTRREKRLAEQWVELTGWPPTGVWSPAWQWAPFLLANFTRKWHHARVE
ncbi:MAG: hypothetical protein A3I08_00730 [Candidatus Andersenbacteria bacterium RIFCSPLOWO2_02_FULL_46_11]|nr:MAG: hypothetical protein UW94_C0012G0034 [Parcubacteria group bacterium GW2011_GWA2_45_14]OGY34440.1 MAG: hypothetical protein A3B76_03975 [Candidatus Andersenbacteria bacterium RIFCSPHIGHO2_02_FULL_46_16]OGY37687.1 MAG: hypothetical protein A3I08_00730 [Candidatus Andersenbacteria bacterium RIFCSPLOWO2_02_FULL_46_11]